MTLTEFETLTVDNFSLAYDPMSPLDKLTLEMKDGSKFVLNVCRDASNQLIHNIKHSA